MLIVQTKCNINDQFKKKKNLNTHEQNFAEKKLLF